MNFKKETTHLVIKFKKETSEEKEVIDLVPITWTYIDDNKLYCKYPEKNEYNKIDNMCKKSLMFKATWKSFKIDLVKEARSYEQGLRRMRKAFSDIVVHSSNVDDQNSSEVEEDPIQLTKHDLKQHLKNIPSFNTNYSTVESGSIFGHSSKLNNENLQSKDFGKNVEFIVNKSSSSSSPNINYMSNQLVLNPNYKYCPIYGSAAKETPASKANLESARRSIEYRIKEEAKITRALFSVNSNTADIEKILSEEIINDLPLNHLESFQDFDNKLKTDVVMMRKLKCFMVLNVKSTLKLSENFSAIIPRIITSNVQIYYSAFGRETNGAKKLNFSGTETYKYLLEVLTSKYPDINGKEISRQMSRWFSGAKDREGGKRERLLKKLSEGKDIVGNN